MRSRQVNRVRSAWQSAHRRRLAAAMPRYLATAVLCVFLVLGVKACFFGARGADAAAPPVTGADAPSEDYALQFARAYLSYDAKRPGLRVRALAPFLAEGLEAAAGAYATSGAQRVRWAQVASDQPALAGGRVITIAAAVSTQRLPIYLAVTVAHPRAQPLRLVGYPAVVGAPSVAPAAPPPREAVEDPAVASVVERVVRNYLSAQAPNLAADLTPEAVVTLPTLALRVSSVERLEWTGAPGSTVLATVSATDRHGSTYTLTYELGVVYRERPYVEFIEVIPTAG
jgi:hypothetical protein